ncbi:MAG: peptidoglycan D,D-transpeptidase FtsI family protein, partial [Egibacteraceae bacterium]
QGCARAVSRAQSRRRLTSLLAGYLIITLLMGWRLVTIQVADAAQFRGLAAAQSQREITLPAERGKLYDRAGEPLAMSLAAATIYANPNQLRDQGADPSAVARQLSPLLERKPADLTRDLRKDAGFVYLGRQLPRRTGEQVQAMALPGVGVLTENRREYPSGGLAAQVVGFAGIDGQGLSGLELGLEQTLAGRAGTMRLERAPGGLEMTGRPRQVVPPAAGDDVVLTLDREIQSAAERSLADAVKRYDAKGGSAVVLDAQSGEVLAMANVPTYDPEHIADAPAAARRNRAVTDIYEPGSVNKVVTASAALEEGAVNLRQRLSVPDSYTVGPKTFSDSHSHEPEKMRLRDIIEQSSNIGTIKVARRLGPERLHRYLQRFGYGRPTGIGFPGEAGGLVPDTDSWWETSLPTISIGQGVSATLLQVASVFQTVANEGRSIQPTLVRGTVGEDGRLQASDPPPSRRVVTADTARAVSDMLVRVVEGEQGTCELCAVPGYHVGGKTGTAQKPSTTRRGYQAGAYIGSFVGFAPAENPALVVGVMLDEASPYYGGLSAGPTFAEIMGFALNHRRVPPSEPKAAAPAPATGAPVAAAADGVQLLDATDPDVATMEETADLTWAEAEPSAQASMDDATADPRPPAWANTPARPVPAWAAQPAAPAGG